MSDETLLDVLVANEVANANRSARAERAVVWIALMLTALVLVEWLSAPTVILTDCRAAAKE